VRIWLLKEAKERLIIWFLLVLDFETKISMALTKEDIIREYKSLKQHLGAVPSNKKFRDETGISQRALIHAFGGNAFSKLVIECGDVPNNFTIPKTSLEEILIQYGELTRKLGKIPPAGEWTYNKCKPNISAIKQSHGLNWGEIPGKFLEFVANKPEWDDVAVLIPSPKINDNPVINAKIEGVTYEYIKFIPPVVQDLQELSINKEKSTEFERQVGLLFQMLGFSVQILGQGTGRNPDIIAMTSKEHYAILIDAKARKDKYEIGTEDRKFIEYINKYKPILINQGYSFVYFLVVSSNFDSTQEKSLKNITRDTGVPTTLITAQQLLKILARKIEHPYRVELRKLKDLFIESGVISDKQLSKL
jgi:hypothetical protein